MAPRNWTTPIPFPEKEWLENLLMNEDRATYAAMTKDQQRVVRFAYLYGVTRTL